MDKKQANQKTASHVIVVIFALCASLITLQLVVTSSQRGLESLQKKDNANAANFTPGLQLYVSVSGNDSNNGRSATTAFKTITRARDEIRTIKQDQGIPSGGIAVNILAGTYTDVATSFGASDSGSSTSPIVYRAAAGQQARFIAGKPLTLSGASTYSGAIKQIALSSAGITQTAPIGQRSSGYDGKAPSELYINGSRMTIAQYPNAPNWAYGSSRAPDRATGYILYECNDPAYDCTKIDNLKGTGNLYVHAWVKDYADLYEPAQIDTVAKKISFDNANNEVFKGKRFKMINALSLIDAAGEYFINPSNNTMYFYPPNTTIQEAYVSTNESVFELNNASNIRFERLTMEMAYGNLIDLTNSSDIHILGNTLRNSGKNAVHILGGANNIVKSNDMYKLGEGGVILDESSTIKTSNVSVINNHIYNYSQSLMSYRPAVRMQGSGHRSAHNKIHDAPNMGTWIEGKNNILEYNEIYDVVKQSGDMGPFYTGKSNSVDNSAPEAGIYNEVRFNYMYDIDPNQFRKSRGQFLCEGTSGIYLDNFSSNYRVYGNILNNTGIRGIFVNNGKSNVVQNNIIMNAQFGVYVQHREWDGAIPPKANNIQNNIYYKTELAFTPKYLKAGSIESVPSSECPGAKTQANLYKDNTIVPAEGGYVATTDPQVINASKQLISGKSTVIQALAPSFERIPIECIGMYNDEFRTDSGKASVCSTKSAPVTTPAPATTSAPAPTTPVATSAPIATPAQTAVPAKTPPTEAAATISVVVSAAGNVTSGLTMPTFELRVKDVSVGSRTVTGQLANYTFAVPLGTLPSDIKIVYTNDISTMANGVRVDRDLRVDSITLNETVYRSDAIDTYSTGTWTSTDGCKAGFKKSVWLHCGGYFQYKTSTSAPTSRIEAETFDATGGYYTVQGVETSPGVLKAGGYIYRFDPRDWVKYSNINLTGKTKLDINIAPRTNNGVIEVRTGSATGAIIGKLTTTNADTTLTKYSIQSIQLTPTTGIQDIYLVGTNTYEVGRIDWFELK